jgi:phospholipid/cholesterol/gamma-HCH transport system substrate-binding protein
MASWIRTPEFKVGFLVVVVSTLVGGMAMKLAEGPGLLSGTSQYYFRADSAGGLIPNSAVKMAGIKIGVIDKILLEDGRARIVIALDGDTKLTESATVQLKSDGILGDKHVEVVPGKPEDPQLPSGSQINLAAGKGGMDDVMGEVARVAKSMNELLDMLNRAAKDADDSTSIGRIMGNIEDLTADLSEITNENKGKLNDIMTRVQNLSKNIDTYINEETLSRVDRSLKNIEEITAKLNKGEGTLGRLINDEQTVEELNSAITSVNKFLGGADKLETSVDFHSEFLTANSQSKSFIGLKLQPGLDRYYEIQAIDDPTGVKRSTLSKTSTNGGPEQTFEETTTYRNKLKITAIFAKNFWDLTIKGGLIENAGGMGLDYYFLNRQLRFSAEFFNFEEMQIRAFVRYNFFKGAYVIAGGDNILGKDDGEASAFVGAGLFITNDDLKLLASKFSF